MQNRYIYNITDASTTLTAGKTIKERINILAEKSRLAKGWFKENNMLANADKFQAILVKGNSHMLDTYLLNITSKIINSDKSIKLNGINIDNKLNFDEQISSRC